MLCGVLLYDPRQIAKDGEPATCRKCQRFRSATSYRKRQEAMKAGEEGDLTGRRPALRRVRRGRGGIVHRTGTGEGPRLRTGPAGCAAERIERVTTTETEFKIEPLIRAGLSRVEALRAATATRADVSTTATASRRACKADLVPVRGNSQGSPSSPS